MINSNIRTQLQAKINAANASTSTAELMLMRVAAQGMNLFESNLDTLLATKLNSLTPSNDTLDFVEAWRSLGIDDHVAYTTPVDVVAGDILWVDPVGGVTKGPYPTSACLTNQAARGVKPYASGFERAIIGSVSTGVVNASAGECCAALNLSDGNVLFLMATTPWAGGYAFSAEVISENGSRVESTYDFNPAVTGDGITASSHLIAAWEQSPNVFRVWITTREAATGADRKLGYFTLTYNTSSKQVTYSAGAQVLLNAASEDLRAIHPRQRQGQRYVMFRAVNNKLFCLDLQSSTVVEYTAVGSAFSQATPYDFTTAGDEYARLVYGSTIKLAKAGSNTLADLPANLVSDGCFNTANSVRHLGSRQYLCYNISTRVAKLVAFGAGYTSCNIWSLGTMPRTIDLSLIRQIWKQSTKWTVVTPDSALTFNWDGLSAPNKIDASRRVKGYAAYYSDPEVLQASDRFAMASGGLDVNLNGAPDTELFTKGFLFFNAAEYHPCLAAPFGIALTDATAGSLVELALLPGTVRDIAASWSVDVVSHQRVITSLRQEYPSFTDTDFYVSTSTGNAGAIRSNVMWVLRTGRLKQYAPVASVQGVFFARGFERIVTEGAGYVSYTGGLKALTPAGLTTRTTNVSSSEIASIYAELRSGGLFSVAGQQAKFYAGVEL